ncbi:MAG: hypothetical protein RSE93_00600 [Oscillospiraceae bacterium]
MHKNKIGKILFAILSITIISFLALLLLTVVITRKTGNPVIILNHSLMIITDDSMGDSIPKDSLMIIKKTSPLELEENDVVILKDGDNNATKRIISIMPSDSGLTFITKSDKLETIDNDVRNEQDIIGEVIAYMYQFGKFLTFVKSPKGLILCIALSLIILLVIEILNVFLFKGYEDDDDEDEEYDDDEYNKNATRFGTKSRERMQTPLTTDDIKENLSDTLENIKVRGIPKKYSNMKTPENIISENKISPKENTLEFEKIVPIEDDETIHKPKEFKIEPIAQTNIRITPHKIETIQDEALRIKSETITTVQDDIDEQAKIIENMGEFEFDHPEELIFDSTEHSSFLTGRKKIESSEFSANIQGKGKDSFVIDGVNVRVKPNAIKLNLDENSKGKNIFITVSENSTELTVGGDDFNLNFSLIKEEDENKVLIKKISK